MSSLLSLLGGLWSNVGPGLILALALPLTLVVLTALALESIGRRKGRSAAGD
jgi:hypothetical protein